MTDPVAAIADRPDPLDVARSILEGEMLARRQARIDELAERDYVCRYCRDTGLRGRPGDPQDVCECTFDPDTQRLVEEVMDRREQLDQERLAEPHEEIDPAFLGTPVNPADREAF